MSDGLFANHAIRSTLAEDAPLRPVHCRDDGDASVRIETAVLDRLGAMRRSGESSSDVIPPER
jgi:hypothetical protein